MTMPQLHLKALEMMERVRLRQPEFWYGTRVRNSPQADKDRIAEGYVFLGDETYIWIPICPISIPENNTKAAGVVFRIESDAFAKAYFEVVVPGPNSKAGEADPRSQSHLSGLVRLLKGPLSKSGTKCKCYWTSISTGGNVVLDTEKWLNANLPAILKHLSGFKPAMKPYTMVYSKQIMARNIDQFQKARGLVADSTCQKIQEIRSKI